MSELKRIRETGKAIAAIRHGMRAEREKMTRATREAVTADAVRGPDRESMAEYAARMDAAQRALRGLMAEKKAMEAREKQRLERSAMSEKRREFIVRYYLRGESRIKLEEELNVSRWSVRRWIAAEEGRRKKG